jgi:hypothetical protein
LGSEKNQDFGWNGKENALKLTDLQGEVEYFAKVTIAHQFFFSLAFGRF